VQIQAIAFEGAEIDQAGDVDEWMGRSLNHQLEVRIAAPKPAAGKPAPATKPTVNVTLEFRGKQFQLAVPEGIKEKDFKKEAKKRLSIPTLKHTRVEMVGEDDWSLKEEYLYAVYETRQMKIRLHDVKGGVRKMPVYGDKSLQDVCEQLRALWNLEPWVRITITRQDKQPFWIEHKGHYNVITQEDSDADLRKVSTVRIDLMDRTFIIPDYRAVEDPAAGWADLCAKYGFQWINIQQMTVTGHPATGAIQFVAKIASSCSKVKIPHSLRRTVESFTTDPSWKSEELVLPVAMGKEEIWKRLQTMIPLPHHSQFQIISGKNDISTAATWPAGHIQLNPIRFPVAWRLEWPQEQSEILEVTRPNMTAMYDVQEAWRLLHAIVPGLYERATLNYLGNLQPGQTIQAEAAREEATVGIRFSQQKISNMSPRSEIHARYIKADTLIPPLACYVREETRPYHDEDLITFRLRKDVPIPDLSGNEGGVAGGDNRRGLILHAIEYPAPGMDISEGKIQGGRKSALVDGAEPAPVDPDSDDSCVTDSGEDAEDLHGHKLIQLAQAVHKGQPILIAIRGQYKGYEGQEVEILFQKFHEGPAPDDLRETWEHAMAEIVELSALYCSEGIPNSLIWAQPDTPREHMNITVAKLGKRTQQHHGTRQSGFTGNLG
jgi:hypothetical protein